MPYNIQFSLYLLSLSTAYDSIASSVYKEYSKGKNVYIVTM
jgi:hypothetical protein